MSDNTDYNREEWRDLVLLASIGLGIKFSQMSSAFSIKKIFSTVKEAFSYQQLLSKLQSKYPGNDLIADIVKNLQRTGKNSNEKSDFLKEINDFESLIARVNDTLQEKSHEKEAGEYRAFVYELACEVCKSAGGGFLGLNPEIDAEEAEFLKKLKAALLEN